MAREDSDRRRLRSLYDRNRSRVSALADARDRRRGGDDNFTAPRRYVVSERLTRAEGFGRGGAQVRRVVRRSAQAKEQPPARRFSDRGIFRRGGRDRFRRAEDVEREDRRDRNRDNRQRRGQGRQEARQEGGGTRRFGESRRARLRMRSRRGGGGGGAREDRREIEDRRQGGSRRGGDGRRNNSGNNNNSNNNKARNNNNNNNNGNNRGGNNNGNSRNNNNNNNRGGNNNNNRSSSSNNRSNNNNNRAGRDNQPRRAREQPMTREQLDRQLDSYHN